MVYRAIVVDDEPYTREGLRLLVDWAGCGFVLVGEAGSAEDALVLLERERPDLMICDVRMPGMQGTELALEAHARYPALMIAFISGYQRFDYARDAIRAQAFCYLVKPIDQEDVEKQLRRILGVLDARLTNPRTQPAEPPAGLGQGIAAMWHYIYQHLPGPASLEALASELHLHQGYLGQWIKKQTGHTFHQHLTRARMEEARRLLLQTDKPIKEIAWAVGIGDVDYFAVQFKREHGLTPGQLRKKRA